MDRTTARAPLAKILLAALALTGCSEGQPHIARSADGKTSVLTIHDFSADDDASQAALRSAQASTESPQVAVAIGLDAAIGLAEAARGPSGPGLSILVADTPSSALDAALERGDVTGAVRIPNPSLAAADAAILLAHRVALPSELHLPEPRTPGRTTLELLRLAHRPTLEEPRLDGRPLVLGCVWTDSPSGRRPALQRGLRTRCTASGGALRLLERQSGDPASDAVDLLALGADALILEGGDPTRLLPAIRAARAVEVPAVSFDPKVPRNLADCAVRLDPTQIGRLLGEAAARHLGDRGGLVILIPAPGRSKAQDGIDSGLLEALGVTPGNNAWR
jgi:ABC-type sugar transport system substrate-binding protein